LKEKIEREIPHTLRPYTENKIIFRIRGQKKLRPNPHALRGGGKRGFNLYTVGEDESYL